MYVNGLLVVNVPLLFSPIVRAVTTVPVSTVGPTTLEPIRFVSMLE
jgi:hypothetical protein